jgi:ribosome-binding factor A
MDDLQRMTRFSEELAHQAAEFILQEMGRQSLVTVTRAQSSDDFNGITIFVTVFPESEQEKALAWLKRSRTAFRDFIAKKSPGLRPPTIDFVIDLGERNRRLIDEKLKPL